MAGNLVVKDSEYKQCEVFLNAQGNRYENAIDAFLYVLTEIRKTGIKAGETADALDELIRSMDALRGKARKITLDAMLGTEDFLREIDLADGSLY